MSVVLRNNAVQSSLQQVGQTGLGQGGSGRGPLGLRRTKAPERWRHSRDPAAELMPAAAFLGQEPDFAAILEDFRDSPFDPSKRRVLGRLMGVFAMDYQGARAEERRFLRRLLAARNAREGYAANRALHLCGVPHIIRRTLALGVAEARSPTGPMGGFLGAVQARIAATTFRLLGPLGRERVWNLLTRAGIGADGKRHASAEPILERALILKALSARRHRLGPWSTDGMRALDEVEEFADGIRGTTRAWLAARTTLQTIDAAREAPNVKALAGPALAALKAQGDMDPHFAWKQHRAAPQYADPARTSSKRETSAEDAMPDLDRGPLLDRVRLHQALAQAKSSSGALMDIELAEAIDYYVGGQEMTELRTKRKDDGLKILMNKGFDVARVESLDAIREDARGTYKFEPARAFGDLMCRTSGASYVRRVFSDQITAGADPLNQISAALAAGLSVPITVKELAHRHMRAFVALGTEQASLHLYEPHSGTAITAAHSVLMSPQLPAEFGRKARADVYLAPAALDLLAPPFGLVLPHLGIEDQL